MSVRSQLGKILIANRGEIACRVIRTAKKLGVKTVAVYSDVDVNSIHVHQADEAYYIGKASAQESYLRGDKLIEVAVKSGAQGIHPGYGFLSENAEFAESCSSAGLIFIGPPPSAIRDMGIKSTSKELISSAGVRVVPGYHGSEQSPERLIQEAEAIGFPLMIKAVRGGGGKGMRIARTKSEFLDMLESAKRESLRAFGDDAVLLERFIERPRHVEVQVFGDSHGNYVHLFERDCSLQRRHQKVIEQAPAPHLSEETRAELGRAGCRAAEAVRYVGAGTVEFILDTKDSAFYFMEMNTRLQVEHPVTEMVTGVDLVEWQLRVASGEPLPLGQSELELRGHAVEARIYAESAEFLPTAGRIEGIAFPSEEGIRIETGVKRGDEVTVHYDPMIAKLIVWDQDQTAVFHKLDQALKDFNIVGVENNVDFLRSLAQHKDLISGNVDTNFIEEHKEELKPRRPNSAVIAQAALGRLLLEVEMARDEATAVGDRNNPFSLIGPFRLNQSYKKTFKFKCHGTDVSVDASYDSKDWYSLSVDGGRPPLRARGRLQKRQSSSGGSGQELGQFYTLTVITPDSVTSQTLAFTHNAVHVFDNEGGFKFELEEKRLDEAPGTEGRGTTVGGGAWAVSPMPGILERVAVSPGDVVRRGDTLATLIAMKMEYVIKAERDGKVKEVKFKAGDNVGKNVPIVILEL